MLSINTNLSSLIAQNSLKSSTNKLNQAIERMSTGFKINHASDNAANYSIATNLDTKIGSLEVAEDNTNMALDILVTASDNLSLIQDRVQRLRDLQEQASNGTYGEESLNAINAECNSLVDEINRLYISSEYNGINLFLETTYSADGTAEILQDTYADIYTTFNDLGITSSSFSVYDRNNNIVETYDIDGDNSIYDVFTTLENHNFVCSISSGKISVKSAAGSYIKGALVDELGITTEAKSFVVSTAQTSTMPVTYESVSSSTSEETVYTTTTTSTTQTQTVDVITTTEHTQTETITVTTTTEQTVTETIPVTTTTEQTVTETISVDSTIGVAKSSSANVTYKNVSVDSVGSLSIAETTTVAITVTAMSLFGNTVTITPTYCETLGEFKELILSEYTLASGEVSFEYASGVSGGGYVGLLTVYFKKDGYASRSKMNITCTNYLGESGSYYTGIKVPLNPKYDTYTVTTTTTSTQTATSSTKLSTIGVSSTQYITVQNNGTQTIITCKTSDTIGSVTAKLTSAGITASFSSGKISLAESETAYISGMSSTLMSKLNLSGDFSSVKTTSTEIVSTIYVTTTTDSTTTSTIYITTTAEETRTETVYTTTTTAQTQTQTLYTTTTSSETKTVTTYVTTTETATGDTTLADMGMTSGVNLGLVINGNNTSVNLSKNTSINDLISILQAKGLSANFNDNKLTIEGVNDSYISSSTFNNKFKLGALNKTMADSFVNTQSESQVYSKNLLDELGNIFAPGSFEFQIGIYADSNSRIGVKTAFQLVGCNDFRNIGKEQNNYLDQIDATLEVLNARQVELGSAQNRLISVLEEIAIRYDNLASSRSTIRDADIAEVSSHYIQQQILQQASATLLSTANQAPSIALQLI